jgi:hypothetical protein
MRAVMRRTVMRRTVIRARVLEALMRVSAVSYLCACEEMMISSESTLAFVRR